MQLLAVNNLFLLISYEFFQAPQGLFLKYNVMSTPTYKSTKKRIKEILKIVQREYEIHNNKRCYKAIWRNIIHPKYGICYDTLLSYIKVKPSNLNEEIKK